MSSNLSYQGFKNVLISQLNKKLENRSNKTISVNEMIKDNDVIQDAISIDDGCQGMSPCIYLNDLYKLYDEGVNMEEIIEFVKDIISTNKECPNPEMVAFDMYDNWEEAAKFITCRLVNRDINRRRLDGVVHRIIGEFAIAYQFQVSDGAEGFFTMQITKDFLEKWCVNEEALYKAAMDNMKLPVNFVLRKLNDVLEISEENIMFVLTTKSKCYGAITIISQDVREKVAKYVNDDYYILPSSVHELIIVPKKHVDSIFELEYLVKSINRGPFVPANEFLSDNIYEYDRKRKTLSLAGNPEMTITPGGIIYENCQCTGH